MRVNFLHLKDEVFFKNNKMGMGNDPIACEVFDTVKHLKKYAILKKNMHLAKQDFQNRKALTSDINLLKKEVNEYLFQMLTDSIFSYWYGTPWAFGGFTETPRKGEVACGYFITTTLRDLGYLKARIKLAQQPASTIIKATCASSTIRIYSSLEELQTHLANAHDRTVFVIGLDSHTGFVVKENGRLHFIHSNYAGTKKVSKELLSESSAIGASGIFMIGNLSKRWAEKWLGI